MKPGQIHAVQTDRDYAAEVWLMLYPALPKIARQMLEGKEDHNNIVQAFARYRTALQRDEGEVA